MVSGDLFFSPTGCPSCLMLGASSSSSTRHSGCWNKKSRPKTKISHQPFSNSSFSSRCSYLKTTTTSLVLFFLVTLTCFPLVTTATNDSSTQAPSSSSSSTVGVKQPPHPLHSSNSDNNNTDVASQPPPSPIQKGSSFFASFDFQQSGMASLLAENLTLGYLDALIDQFGSDGSIGKKELSDMIDKLSLNNTQKSGLKKPGQHRKNMERRNRNKHQNTPAESSGANGDLSSVCSRLLSGIDLRKKLNGTNLNYSVEDQEGTQSLDLTQLLSCQVNKCMNASSIFQLYNLTDDYRLTRTDLLLLTPLILRQVQTCQHESEEVGIFSKSSEAWAYGFLFVTVINVCALVGVVVLPIMNTRIYKKVLLFLVALAVGSLAGSGLLVLIPEAFELVGTREEKHAYLWMGTTIMSGVYLFFLIERFLKLFFEWKKRGKSASEADYDVIMDKNENRQLECATDELSDMVCSVKSKTPVDLDAAKMKDPANYHASASQCTSHLSRTESAESIEVKLQKKTSSDDGNHLEVPNGCLHTRGEGGKKKQVIRTVAWMIIFGDGLHNFIDGLSIGAAFTANTMTGVSVSVAVICEELPHELGDFAILLNAGMSMKQALCFNFLSACMCYIGLIFGILLAEATAAHTWIFGVAGGMFLYISLVDMMPEMNQVVEAKENQHLGWVQLFILQNLGMIMGFSIILVISLYAEQIQFGS